MSVFLFEIGNMFLLIMALSVDTFAASLLYGGSKVKIPFLSNLTINGICTALLTVSLAAGKLVSGFIPQDVTKMICFLLLFGIGSFKLFDSSIKALIKKKQFFSRKVAFSISGLRMVLNIYADPYTADVDESHDISPKEAVALAMALSFDGLGVGFGAAFSQINIPVTILTSLLVGMFAVHFGIWAGEKLTSKTEKNFSWLSGFLMMIFAFLKLR